LRQVHKNIIILVHSDEQRCDVYKLNKRSAQGCFKQGNKSLPLRLKQHNFLPIVLTEITLSRNQLRLLDDLKLLV